MPTSGARIQLLPSSVPCSAGNAGEPDDGDRDVEDYDEADGAEETPR